MYAAGVYSLLSKIRAETLVFRRDEQRRKYSKMDKRSKDNLVHRERMGEDRMPQKIFTQELEGTRRSGRLRKRWKEEVETDLQVLGVRWRELVADRKKWNDIVRQAKAHSGL
jgi:hypothetical protein